MTDAKNARGQGRGTLFFSHPLLIPDHARLISPGVHSIWKPCTGYPTRHPYESAWRGSSRILSCLEKIRNCRLWYQLGCAFHCSSEIRILTNWWQIRSLTGESVWTTGIAYSSLSGDDMKRSLSRFSTLSWRVGKRVRNYSVCMRI